MNDVKSALESRTVWAGIVTILASVAGFTGHQFSAADQASSLDAVLSAVTAVSGLVAIWGRVVASKKIG